MSRHVDPDRKPQLLAQIIEVMLDVPLHAMTFRSVAERLDVSPFTLVYHFGTKDALVGELVDAICGEQLAALVAADLGSASVDAYLDGVRRYWEWSMLPRNCQLQRLVFEAAMTESLRSDHEAVTRRTLLEWHALASAGLLELGVPAELASAESRAIADVMHGLQYDLIVTNNTGRATAAFESAIAGLRVRIHAMSATAN
ncbi:MAG TPA: TetR/AcrR family transcriptional regulator [Gaiellaceae bacterium]|nr:TetR/AcrR family transcriptional regulator [Gaiellaceae bacterium]